MVVAGPMFWPLERAADVLCWYRSFIPNAPDDLNGFFAIRTSPPAEPFPEELHDAEGLRRRLVLDRRPAAGADAALAEARAQPGLLLDGVQQMPFPVLQSVFDGSLPGG